MKTKGVIAGIGAAAIVSAGGLVAVAGRSAPPVASASALDLIGVARVTPNAEGQRRCWGACASAAAAAERPQRIKVEADAEDANACIEAMRAKCRSAGN